MTADHLLEGVTLVTGDGTTLEGAVVRCDGDGVVTAIEVGAARGDVVLMPAAVDLHLDVLAERRRPRASVLVDLRQAVMTLDAELASAGLGVVCIGARIEDEPARGVRLADGLELCDAVESLAPLLVCDWRIHARVEVTEEQGPAALEAAFARTSRVALVSIMDHSAEKSRFGSVEAHRAFYAEDWGLAEDEVDRILDRRRAGAAGATARRAAVADLAHRHGVALASHDDRTAADVESAAGLGAVIAEFPLTMGAARRATALGLTTVLGAPNAVRGRSTSPGNLLVTEAVGAGVCDVLCADYLPSALLRAPFALAERDGVALADAIAMITTSPAAAIGLVPPRIAVGEPLDAVAVTGGSPDTGAQALARWRQGRLVHLRGVAPLAVA